VGERERGGCVELRVIKAPYTQSEEDSLHSKRGGQPALKARRTACAQSEEDSRRRGAAPAAPLPFRPRSWRTCAPNPRAKNVTATVGGA